MWYPPPPHPSFQLRFGFKLHLASPQSWKCGHILNLQHILHYHNTHRNSHHPIKADAVCEYQPILPHLYNPLHLPEDPILSIQHAGAHAFVSVFTHIAK